MCNGLNKKLGGQVAATRQMDVQGAAALVGFAALMAFNQVVIKVANDGFQPVFLAGLRSAGALVCMALWMRWRGLPFAVPRDQIGPGLLIGVVFAAEFIFLFIALDLTTVIRVSIIYYSMPVWLALAAGPLLGERLTARKSAGLALAFAGVVVALVSRGDDVTGQASLLGDLLALAGAMAWAGIALCARGTRLREATPEMQLVWQLIVSAPILLLAAAFFGPLLRDPQAIHIAGLLFQVVVIASFGYLLWLWLLGIYPAAQVASFSFLSPLFGVLFGGLLLGERLGPGLALAAGLLAVGLVLINRTGRRAAPPV